MNRVAPTFAPIHRVAAWSLAVTLLMLAWPRSAAAQHWSLHGAGAVAMAWTDNAANNPVNPRDDELPARAALFFQIRPSVLFTFESPRTIHVSSFGADLTAYTTNDPPSTYNLSFAHNSLFSLSAKTELAAGAAMNTGRVNAVLGEVGGDVIQAAPRGAADFIGANLNQALRSQLSRHWRLTQEAGYAQVETRVANLLGVNNSKSLSSSLTLTSGLDRTWARTSAGVTVMAGHVGITQEQGAQVTLTRQMTGSVALRGRRDLGPRWSTHGQLGAATLRTYEATDPGAEGTIVVPSGALGIIHYRELGRVTGTLGLSFNRSIQPNLLLGTTTVSTGGVLSGSMPLPFLFRAAEPTVRINTTVGRSFAEIADQRFDPAPSWHVDVADLAVTWSPREAVHVALRYQYIGSVVTEDTRARAEEYNIPVPVDFRRNTVLIEVRGRWPARQATSMPDRRTMRVDRANEQAGELERAANQ